MVDFVLRAIARILSELSWASRAVRWRKSRALCFAFTFPGIAAMEPPSFAPGAGAASSVAPVNCRKNVSSALIGPFLFSDGTQRNCSGIQMITQLEFGVSKQVLATL